MTPTPEAAVRAELARTPHRKSSYSTGTGSCVEIAHAHHWVSIRDTKQPAEQRDALLVPDSAFTALVQAVRAGRLH